MAYRRKTKRAPTRSRNSGYTRSRRRSSSSRRTSPRQQTLRIVIQQPGAGDPLQPALPANVNAAPTRRNRY